MSWRDFVADERGAAYVETLVSFVAVLLAFLQLYHFAYVCAADLIVERAAAAAARAAIVILPDSPAWYWDNRPETRVGVVTEAARRVLLASGHFDPAALRVSVTGGRGTFSPITATVETKFDCSAFMASWICGADDRFSLSAQATLPYMRDQP